MPLEEFVSDSFLCTKTPTIWQIQIYSRVTNGNVKLVRFLEIVSKQRFEAKQRLFAHLTMNVVLCFGQKAPLYDFLGGNTGDAASNYFNVI